MAIIDDVKIHFVCVRGSHHRHAAATTHLCRHLGCPAFCPAGDVGEHEWVVTSTDIATLARLGYVVTREPAGMAERTDEHVLIRV